MQGIKNSQTVSANPDTQQQVSKKLLLQNNSKTLYSLGLVLLLGDLQEVSFPERFGILILLIIGALILYKIVPSLKSKSSDNSINLPTGLPPGLEDEIRRVSQAVEQGRKRGEQIMKELSSNAKGAVVGDMRTQSQAEPNQQLIAPVKPDTLQSRPTGFRRLINKKNIIITIIAAILAISGLRQYLISVQHHGPPSANQVTTVKVGADYYMEIGHGYYVVAGREEIRYLGDKGLYSCVTLILYDSDSKLGIAIHYDKETDIPGSINVFVQKLVSKVVPPNVVPTSLT